MVQESRTFVESLESPIESLESRTSRLQSYVSRLQSLVPFESLYESLESRTETLQYKLQTLDSRLETNVRKSLETLEPYKSLLVDSLLDSQIVRDSRLSIQDLRRMYESAIPASNDTDAKRTIGRALSVTAAVDYATHERGEE